VAASTDIANLALSILGKPAITSFADNSNAARVLTIEYDLLRRALLMGPSTWRFSIGRASLPALTAKPVSGPYTQMFAMPTDCLRILLVGDTYPGLDLTDYRLGPDDSDYAIEGRNILCDYGAPVSLKYIRDITDTTQMDPQFIVYFASKLAWTCCERLTGSDAKQAAAEKRMLRAMSEATSSNAFENPPDSIADDSWVAARLL
jgi:hypothetical protein